MICPNCGTEKTTKLKKATSLGYPIYRCAVCRKQFNQRSGTVFNYLQFPTDIVLLAVRWRLRYKLSLRDIAEMFLERGFQFTHEAVREWEERFAPMIANVLRTRRRKKPSPSWYVDETYIKISGEWCYLYRAIDRDGNLVDCRLSLRRDLRAAKSHFQKALESTGRKPNRITTDGHIPYVGAIKEVFGERTLHRTSRYLNNLIEQDHRGIKGRYGPMRGFKSFTSASRFCAAYDELRNYYRPQSTCNEKVSLSDRRLIHISRTADLTALLTLDIH